MRRLIATALLALISVLPEARAVNEPAQLAFKTAWEWPYLMVGQVWFTSGTVDYIGSGTVVRPKGVLTAGHNIYDPSTGWSTDVEFRRGTYNAAKLGDDFTTRLYVLAGYQAAANTYGSESVRTFASDAAGMAFDHILVGKGAWVPYAANANLLMNPIHRVAIGYGAERHSGQVPLYVSPTANFYRTYGSFWENQSLDFEGGMSGGPVFSRTNTGSLVVTAIVVSSSGPPVAGGVRILDAPMVSFINTYLK